MRFAELALAPFGAHRDVTLRFAERASVELIYGPNEAGKSTALRAIEGLLYGIPHHSPDAHSAPGKDLRIGATLVDDEGGRLAVVRRKGRSKTLLDPSGQPIDEAPLRRMLGGVGRELFRTLFGLDHESLRQGADALLRGGGEVGKSLYEAALGTARVGECLSSLQQLADDLFTPTARTRPINTTLRAYLDAQKRIRDKQVDADAYGKQVKAIAQTEKEIESAQTVRRDVAADLERSRRDARLLPLVQQRAALRVAMEGLTHVPRLSAEAPARRQEAQRARDSARVAVRRAEEQLAGLKHRADVDGGDLLSAEMEALLEGLEHDRGRAQTAHAELPELRAELSQLTASITRRRSRLPERDGLHEEGSGGRSRIAELAARGADVQREVSERQRAADRLRLRRAELEQRLAATEESGRQPTLEPQLDAAREALSQAGTLDATVERQRRLAHRMASVRQALGIGDADLDALSAHVPSEAACLNILNRQAEAERAASDARLAKDQAAAREREVSTRLTELREVGDVVDEAQVAKAQAERDRLVDELERDRATDMALLRSAIQHLDALVARRFAQAHRAAQVDACITEQVSLTERAAEADRRLRDAEASVAALAAAYEALWPESITPPALTSAEAWLGRLAQLRDLAAEVEEANASSAALSEGRRRAIEALAEALGASSDGAHNSEDELRRLITNGEQVRQSVQEQRAERQRVRDQFRQLAEELLVAEQDARDAQTRLAEWQQSWERALTPLGLPSSTSAQDALDVVEELASLQTEVLQAERVQLRLEGQDEIVRSFERRVLAAARAVLGASPQPPEGESDADWVSLVAKLLGRLATSRSRRQVVERLQEERAQAEVALSRAQADLAEAGQRLGSLLSDAGVDDEAALEEIEAKATRRRELEDKAAELQARLTLEARDEELDALETRLAALDVEQLDERIEQLEARLEEVERDVSRAHQQLGSARAGLAQLQAARGAADAALEAQMQLARLGDLTREFLRLRIAAAGLEHAIETYRRENQDPVLKRATELFEKLTLGRYKDLRVELGNADELELRAVRADGISVDVVGLSDGSRDQLFLSLRIAALERRLDEAPPLPLVLDDALVHFDDDRAEAALAVLGEVARRTQVLFFTHHERMLELAQRAVPSERLAVHELERAPLRG